MALAAHRDRAETSLGRKPRFSPLSDTPTMITKVLKGAVSLSGENLEVIPKYVSARSLRAAGAMALLCSGIDKEIIQLIGRWRSDKMLR